MKLKCELRYILCCEDYFLSTKYLVFSLRPLIGRNPTEPASHWLPAWARGSQNICLFWADSREPRADGQAETNTGTLPIKNIIYLSPVKKEQNKFLGKVSSAVSTNLWVKKWVLVSWLE